MLDHVRLLDGSDEDVAVNSHAIINDILRREGSSYMNHPADKGGPTKYGITQATLSEFRRVPALPGDVAALTENEAREIYSRKYIIDPGMDRIADEKLAALAIDSGVNHGPGRVIRWLQEIVGVHVDGILENQTEDAINTMNPKTVFKKLLARRVRFYGEIISRDHSQAVFAAGWMNRVMEFIEYV